LWLRAASFGEEGGLGNSYQLSDSEFGDNLKLRLCIKLYAENRPRKCECNANKVFAVNENHFHGFSCIKAAAIRTQRHTQLNKLLKDVIKKITGGTTSIGECQFEDDEKNEEFLNATI